MTAAAPAPQPGSEGAGAGALPDFVQPLGHGVYAIDTGFQRPRFDAAYLMVHEGRAAFLDTGPNFAVPRHLAALKALGVPPEAVDWVIPTHVHLDHAGGAGLLMQHLPHARLLVHPRGARHLIDPTALYQGALAVYGQEEMDRSYGNLVGVDPARIDTSTDGTDVHLAGRCLHLIDTPGHARHHHCIWDETSRGWFTGDTFGLSYREFDTAAGAWILPTSTPVQFEPGPLRSSIERLLAYSPEAIYLTHYGGVCGVPRLGQILLGLLAEMAELGERLRDVPHRHERLCEALGDMYLASLREHGCRLSDDEIGRLLDLDVTLNAQGMACWLDRR